MIHNKTQRAIFKKDGNIYCVYNDCFIINPFNCNVPKIFYQLICLHKPIHSSRKYLAIAIDRALFLWLRHWFHDIIITFLLTYYCIVLPNVSPVKR